METSVNKHIDKLKEVNIMLDKLTAEDSLLRFNEVYDKVEQIKKDKEHLLNTFGKEELKIFNEEIEQIIKQIREKFDNIVEENKKLQTDLKKELEQLANKKKLANYQR